MFDSFLTKRAKKETAVFLAALLLAASAQAARRPLNPRKFKKKTAAEAVAKPSSAPPVVAPRNIPRLSGGRWEPAVKTALEEFIADHSSATAAYDHARPPVAILPWNDASVVGDAGSIVFQKLVERADFKFDDEFWRLVPLVHGRQRLRAAYDIFSNLPVSVWESQPEYQQYRKGFFAAYRDMCAKVGRGECRAWLARLLEGFGEEELARYVQGAVREESLRPVSEEAVYAALDDTAPVSLRRGMARIPEIRELVDLLMRSGFDVWVMDTDSQKILEVAAKEYGIDPSRAEGIRLRMNKEKFAPEITGPIPIRAGKVEVAASRLGRPPQLVIGAKSEDEEILRYSAGLRLVLGDIPALRKPVEEGGWLVQPAFR